jgi:hypothetical protein
MSRPSRLLTIVLLASVAIGAAACSDVTAPPLDCDGIQGSQTCMQAGIQGSQT